VRFPFIAELHWSCKQVLYSFSVVVVVVVVVVVKWERIRGPAAPMHLGRMNGPFVHRF
jgi:hypothetical protein